jgi:hypothetical protein
MMGQELQAGRRRQVKEQVNKADLLPRSEWQLEMSVAFLRAFEP